MGFVEAVKKAMDEGKSIALLMDGGRYLFKFNISEDSFICEEWLGDSSLHIEQFPISPKITIRPDWIVVD